MKKIVELLSICSLLLSGSLFASTSEKVCSSFGYMNVGLGPFPLPLPIFGLGYRAQRHQHGFDISLQVSTIVMLTHIKGSLLYQHYFRPSFQSQFYIGGGLGVSGLFGTYGNDAIGAVSPEFVFGKQYLADTGGRRFFQMQVSWPTCGFEEFSKRSFSKREFFYYPLVVFSYGVGF